MTMNRLTALLFLISPFFSFPVYADIEIRFIESAPKDSFLFTNSGICQLRDLELDIDLTNTNGKLIFDTTADGDGVEVFQPFENRNGQVELISSNAVNDGDTSLSVRIESLLPTQQVSFTIDVDDTLKDSALGQIRVTGTEIQNGTVTLRVNDAKATTASFDENSRALVSLSGCA